MQKIKVEKASKEELEKIGIKYWNSWGCGKDKFDWEYDCPETCYIQEGAAKIKTQWEEVTIKAGDLVHFPKGLKCIWNVTDPIKKVYKFE